MPSPRLRWRLLWSCRRLAPTLLEWRCCRGIGGGHGGDRHVATMAAAASRLLRAYALQLETLRRWRNGGSQYMRIEHIHIEPDAQAIIDNFQGKVSESSG